LTTRCQKVLAMKADGHKSLHVRFNTLYRSHLSLIF